MEGRSFDKSWVRGEAEKIIRKTCDDPQSPHILIVDEMNLSHPEHYMSDFISAMETGGFLRDEKDDNDESLEWPPGGNLCIVGTVNIDETTQSLSPRLKSRVWVIELRVDWDSVLKNLMGEKQEIATILCDLDRALGIANLGFGYRDLEHIAAYSGAEGGDFNREWMWEALEQKLLPKLRGTKEMLEDALKETVSVLDTRSAPKRLVDRIKDIQQTLVRDGYFTGA